VRSSGRIILFMDELHTIIGAGAAEGAIDAANILKPFLARGEIQLIGATTLEEYRKHIEKDAALERRFQPIDVAEPTEKEALDMLFGLRGRYEEHHNIKISDDAIVAAVKLSARYISDRYLPDKAIDLVDEAASRAKMKELSASPEMKELYENILQRTEEIKDTIKSGDVDKSRSLNKEVEDMKAKLDIMKRDIERGRKNLETIVTEDDIAEVIASFKGIPVQSIKQDETTRLLHLEEELHKRLIGQEEAVSAVSRAIRRGRVGLKDPKRPIGSFLFLGPTGVGKTELCKALAEVLFGDENAIIRIDMSEYMEKYSVSKMIGSPPGYVGYDDGGQLSEMVRRKPYSVVLFDEVEKASPDVFNILLQMLDDGHITDAHGRKVNFKNTVIIMTSNAGARSIIEPKKLGFNPGSDKKSDYEDMKRGVMEEIKNVFKPEFINRIDEIIVFHVLSKEEIQSIVKLMAKELDARGRESMGIGISFDESLIELLSKEGYNPSYGARPLRRVIQTKIEDKFAEEYLKGSFKSGDSIIARAENGEVIFEKQ
ncbi:MAG: ATP-dependent Clp protease ATP-binding subunit, partial [Firmicutes bacterium]|nr:ATP-dependent Clp protease ATP-binding subunit [Bacillota bacterium]